MMRKIAFKQQKRLNDKDFSSNDQATNSSEKISRSTFLKKVGLGSASLMMPNILFGKTSLPEALKIPQGSARKQPNIIVILEDQVRRDALGAFGGGFNFTTPNFDRLASEGTSFRNSISSCPLCTPARGMLLTGRYPTHSGVILNWIQISPEQNPHCLANVFASAGYDTGYIGKWHLAPGLRTPEGLYKPHPKERKAWMKKHPHHEFVPPGPERLGFQFWQAYNFNWGKNSFRNYWYYEDKPKKIYSHKYETDTEFDQAISYMEKRKNAKNPFLLTVAPHPPHPPFDQYPKGYLNKVVPPDQIKWEANVPRDNPRSIEDIRGYYAMIKNADDNMGKLMNYLDNSGLAEDTIVIYTSDHGEMNGSHGRLNKMVPYKEAINIPLIIRWPDKIPKGRFIDAIYTHMDMFPTLCGLTGLDIPKEVDGIDLSDILLGNKFAKRDNVLMANYSSHWDFFQTGTKWPEWRGVFTGRHTYVKWLTGEEELYDNEIDPEQMNNIVEDQDAFLTLQDMRERLKVLLREADDDFRPGNEYADWYNKDRTLKRTGLGTVPNLLN